MKEANSSGPSEQPKRRGRQIEAGTSKSHLVPVRLGEEEKHIIDAAAHYLGLNRSEFFRYAGDKRIAEVAALAGGIEPILEAFDAKEQRKSIVGQEEQEIRRRIQNPNQHEEGE